MEGTELELADDVISAIVKKIIDTRPKNGDEPFFSGKTFWEKGFHRKAFSWLPQDIEFALRIRNAGYGDDPCANFQRRLNDDINKVGENTCTNHLEEFAKNARWCDYKHLRKAVLTILYRQSFPYIAASTTGNQPKMLEYPKWLKGEWIRGVMP